MSDKPKLTPYTVGINFGDGEGAWLHVANVIASSAEHACAHAVSNALQQNNITQPLTRVVWYKMDEEFLIAALDAIRGQEKEKPTLQ